jgi:hypothetical protein
VRWLVCVGARVLGLVAYAMEKDIAVSVADCHTRRWLELGANYSTRWCARVRSSLA